MKDNNINVVELTSVEIWISIYIIFRCYFTSNFSCIVVVLTACLKSAFTWDAH